MLSKQQATFLASRRVGHLATADTRAAPHLVPSGGTGILYLTNPTVRGDAHTNTVEGHFSILKRGIYSVYQHISEHHLKRYLAEFDFRYNERIALGIDDTERTIRALAGIVGKRLLHRDSSVR